MANRFQNIACFAGVRDDQNQAVPLFESSLFIVQKKPHTRDTAGIQKY